MYLLVVIIAVVLYKLLVLKPSVQDFSITMLSVAGAVLVYLGQGKAIKGRGVLRRNL